MGNENTSPTKLANYLERNCTYVKKISVSPYGDIKIMKDNDQNQIAIKTLIINEKEQYETNLHRINNYQRNFNNNHILKILQWSHSNHSELCSNYFKICICYPYHIRNLELFASILREEAEIFSEIDLLSVIYSVISGLIDFKNFQIEYEDVNVENILVNPQNFLEINDIHFMTGDFSAYNKFLIGNGNKCYLSPLLFASLKHRKMTPNHDYEKSNVFSLGICILELFAQDYEIIRKIYNFDEFTIDFSKIEDLISKVKKRFGNNLHYILEMMLKEDENMRIGYRAIENYFLEINFKAMPLKTSEKTKKKMSGQIFNNTAEKLQPDDHSFEDIEEGGDDFMRIPKEIKKKEMAVEIDLDFKKKLAFNYDEVESYSPQENREKIIDIKKNNFNNNDFEYNKYYSKY